MWTSIGTFQIANRTLKIITKKDQRYLTGHSHRGSSFGGSLFLTEPGRFHWRLCLLRSLYGVNVLCVCGRAPENCRRCSPLSLITSRLCVREDFFLIHSYQKKHANVKRVQWNCYIRSREISLFIRLLPLYTFGNHQSSHQRGLY